MIASPIASTLISLQTIPTNSSFPYHDRGHAENQFSWEYWWDSIHLPASLVSFSPWTYFLDNSLLSYTQQWSSDTDLKQKKGRKALSYNLTVFMSSIHFHKRIPPTGTNPSLENLQN